MKTRYIFVMLALFVGTDSLAQQGQTVPDVIHYQGKLMAGTNLFTGVVPIQFRLYDQPTGGDLPLCESTNSVAVVDGYYSAVIGDNIIFGALDNALYHHSGEVWLEVEIDGQVIEPRERLAAVPYARVAAGLPANAVDMGMIKENAVQSWHIGDSAVRNHHLQIGTVSSNRLDWSTMPVISPVLRGYAESGSFGVAPIASGVDAIALGGANKASGDYSAVGGGLDNTAGGEMAVVGGGSENQAQGMFATVGGGA